MLGYGCANTAFAGLAITLVIRREGGILKRIRATPLPPATYLAAVLCSTLVVFVLQMLVMMALGMVLYGASGPQNWLGLVLAVLLGVAAFAGLGFGAAALIRSSEGASAVVKLVVLPMAFLSGSFGPTRRYPAVLQGIADVLPLTYLIRSSSTSTCAVTRSGRSRRRSRSSSPGGRRPRDRLAALRLGAARAMTRRRVPEWHSCSRES